MVRAGLTRMGRASASVLCVRDKGLYVSVPRALATPGVYRRPSMT